MHPPRNAVRPELALAGLVGWGGRAYTQGIHDGRRAGGREGRYGRGRGRVRGAAEDERAVNIRARGRRHRRGGRPMGRRWINGGGGGGGEGPRRDVTYPDEQPQPGRTSPPTPIADPCPGLACARTPRLSLLASSPFFPIIHTHTFIVSGPCVPLSPLRPRRSPLPVPHTVSSSVSPRRVLVLVLVLVLPRALGHLQGISFLFSVLVLRVIA